MNSEQFVRNENLNDINALMNEYFRISANSCESERMIFMKVDDKRTNWATNPDTTNDIERFVLGQIIGCKYSHVYHVYQWRIHLYSMCIWGGGGQYHWIQSYTWYKQANIQLLQKRSLIRSGFTWQPIKNKTKQKYNNTRQTIWKRTHN